VRRDTRSPQHRLVIQARRAAVADGLLPCQRANPQLWFSELSADLELAKAHCRPCPIRGLCLASAVECREPCGVWGGQIFHRGAIASRKAPRGRPPKTHNRPSIPLLRQQLAAEYANDMIAYAYDRRQA
jgi:WhiB family redox-sensing transcriptional regulator